MLFKPFVLSPSRLLVDQSWADKAIWHSQGPSNVAKLASKRRLAEPVAKKRIEVVLVEEMRNEIVPKRLTTRRESSSRVPIAQNQAEGISANALITYDVSEETRSFQNLSRRDHFKICPESLDPFRRQSKLSVASCRLAMASRSSEEAIQAPQKTKPHASDRFEEKARRTSEK